MAHTDFRRYGKPDVTTFAYLVENLWETNVIVYAATMTDALKLYNVYHSIEPHSIRQMADGE